MMPRTVMANDLVVTCSEIVGDVELSDSMVQGTVLLDRSKILGDVRLVRALIDRDVSLKGATLEGSIEATGGRTGGLLLPSAEIHRDIDVSHEVLQALDMNAAQIGGSVKLDDVLLINSLSAHQARIGRSMTLDTVRSANGMDLNELAPAGGLTASNVTVNGSLMLSLSGDYSLVFQDTVVTQNLVLVDGDFGEVSFDRMKVRMGTQMEGSRFRKKLVVGDTDFGALFSASQARFEGTTEFRSVRFAVATEQFLVQIAQLARVILLRVHEPFRRAGVGLSLSTSQRLVESRILVLRRGPLLKGPCGAIDLNSVVGRC